MEKKEVGGTFNEKRESGMEGAFVRRFGTEWKGAALQLRWDRLEGGRAAGLNSDYTEGHIYTRL